MKINRSPLPYLLFLGLLFAFILLGDSKIEQQENQVIVHTVKVENLNSSFIASRTTE